jgi:hypothetical protein
LKHQVAGVLSLAHHHHHHESLVSGHANGVSQEK